MRKGGHDTVRLAGREIDEGGITGENMLVKCAQIKSYFIFGQMGSETRYLRLRSL